VLSDFVTVPNPDGTLPPLFFYKGEVVPKELRNRVLEPREFLQGAPDKYPTMLHADMNSVVNCVTPSTSAVGYLPFEPCENCLLAWFAKRNPMLQVKRLVLLTSRHMPNTAALLAKRPDIKVDVLVEGIFNLREKGEADASNDPAEALLQAAQYCNLMIEQSALLAKDSASVYRDK
jgi:hypothetical protein